MQIMIHTGLTPERWFKFSTFEQLANVGCDVERTIQWKKKGDLDLSQKAFDRALELLDLTIADPKTKGGALRELVRMREFLKDYFLCDNEYKVLDDTFLYNYFFDFSYAAAIQRGR